MKTPFELRLKRPLRAVRLRRSEAPRFLEEQLRQAEEKAFERGRRQGERDLSEQLLRQRSDLLQLQNGVFGSLRQLLPDLLRECESGLVALAYEAVRKVIGGLSISTELIEAVVREALGQVGERSALTIILNPTDLELLEQANSPLLLEQVAGERLNFRAGAEIGRGGCVIQTSFGLIDARRETKLRSLKGSMEA